MKNIAKAIIELRKEIIGLEKDMQVGSGNYGYKGVSDYEVKKLIKPLFDKYELVIIPADIKSKTRLSQWDETDYKGEVKRKQSIFTEAKVTYTLLHSSGEMIQMVGYGHGVDAQDKGAGKATTYALKYALLYLGLIPTGKIDDADSTHSNEIEVSKEKITKNVQTIPSEIQTKVAEAVGSCKSIDDLKLLYKDYDKEIKKYPAIKNMFTIKKSMLK